MKKLFGVHKGRILLKSKRFLRKRLRLGTCTLSKKSFSLWFLIKRLRSSSSTRKSYWGLMKRKDHIVND